MSETLTDEQIENEHEADIAAEALVDYERVKRWVMQRDGKDYIQFAGLLDLLHQESKGVFIIHTHLEQAPTEANGMLAIVSALVTIGADPDGRTATGLGDASPSSVNRMIAPHLVRMAETRAKGRALRDLLNIPLVTWEELGPSGPPAASRAAPATGPRHPLPNNGAGIVHPAPDTLVVDGKTYTRDQLWGFYQQRRTQCRERNVTFPQPPLQRSSDLRAIAEQTKIMRDRLSMAASTDAAVPPGAPA